MRFSIFLLMLLVTQGCALVDANLTIALPEDSVLAGPLSDVRPREFARVRIQDAREDRTRIGHVRNSFDMITADILSDEPVETVVQRAIEEMLVENGHELAAWGIRVTGRIKVFWIESDQNFADVELIGQIECELAFSADGADLYRNDYVGSHSVRVGIVTPGSHHMAIGGALGSVIEAVAYDEALAKALQQWSFDGVVEGPSALRVPVTGNP